MKRKSVRLSTLAEVKVLSLQSFLNFELGNQVIEVINRFGLGISESLALIFMATVLSGGTFTKTSKNIPLALSFFKTVGIAKSIRITENYSTTHVYGLGNPVQSRVVPHNYKAEVSCERLQLDRRGLYDFMTSPEYFYSGSMQRKSGILDAVYYTYMFIRSKEDGPEREEIFALMPINNARTISSNDVMIVNSVNLTGFKIGYTSNLLDILKYSDDITREITNQGGSSVINLIGNIANGLTGGLFSNVEDIANAITSGSFLSSIIAAASSLAEENLQNFED